MVEETQKQPQKRMTTARRKIQAPAEAGQSHEADAEVIESPLNDADARWSISILSGRVFQLEAIVGELMNKSKLELDIEDRLDVVENGLANLRSAIEVSAAKEEELLKTSELYSECADRVRRFEESLQAVEQSILVLRNELKAAFERMISEANVAVGQRLDRLEQLIHQAEKTLESQSAQHDGMDLFVRQTFEQLETIRFAQNEQDERLSRAIASIKIEMSQMFVPFDIGALTEKRLSALEAQSPKVSKVTVMQSRLTVLDGQVAELDDLVRKALRIAKAPGQDQPQT